MTATLLSSANGSSTNGDMISSTVPTVTRFRSLLQQLSYEYDQVVSENSLLRQQVSQLTAALDAVSTCSSSVTHSAYSGGSLQQVIASGNAIPPTLLPPLATASTESLGSSLGLGGSNNHGGSSDFPPPPTPTNLQQQPPGLAAATPSVVIQAKQRSTNTASNLFNKTTSRLVSSLRTSPSMSARLVQTYQHHDGVWDVAATYRSNNLLVASASADYSVCIFLANCPRPLLVYSGHRGSANSVRFFPTPGRDLVLSAAGDNTVHLWEFSTASLMAAVNNDGSTVATSTSELSRHGTVSSDDLESSDIDDNTVQSAPYIDSTAPNSSLTAMLETPSTASTVRTARMSFTGHTAAVVAADFVLGGQQIVSGGWDKVALVFATETGQQVASLGGHDSELTFVAGHPSPSRSLVLTASKDASFRLWDLRAAQSPVHLVAAVQGHSGAVNAACFAPGERIVSGGDDRAVRVWDLRSGLGSPVAVAKPGSPVNRLSIHWSSGLIAAPLDNSRTIIYDMASCNKQVTLPSRQNGGHRRIVSGACWVDAAAGGSQQQQQSASTVIPNLFTAGFDHRLIGWQIALGSGRNSTLV